MTKKSGVFTVIIVIILVVLGIFVARQGANNNNNGVKELKMQGVREEAKEAAVNYTDSGYSPEVLRIKSGTTVVFKNLSSTKTWPASALHPTHRVYPTSLGCIGSTFDACRGLAPQESWSFMFDKIGTWKYHDHLNPSHIGTIIVE